MVCSGMAVLRGSEKLARTFEISRGVDLDAEPASLNQADRDPHACLERAQLLEAFALFEHAARQRDEPLERLSPIGIEPDMLVMRTFAPRDDRLAEIERARRSGRVCKGGDDLVD